MIIFIQYIKQLRNSLALNMLFTVVYYVYVMSANDNKIPMMCTYILVCIDWT